MIRLNRCQKIYQQSFYNLQWSIATQGPYIYPFSKSFGLRSGGHFNPPPSLKKLPVGGGKGRSKMAALTPGGRRALNADVDLASVEAAEDGLPARMVSGRHCTMRPLMGGSSPLTGNAASLELRVTTQSLDGVLLSAGEALRPGSCQAVGAAEMLGEMPLWAEPSGELVDTDFRAGEGNVGGLGCPDSARGEEEAPSLDAASPAQPVQQLRGDGDLLNSGIVTGYVTSGSEFQCFMVRGLIRAWSGRIPIIHCIFWVFRRCVRGRRSTLS